jgi:hypothetical protein
MTLTLGRHFRQDMAFISLLMLKTGGCFTKSFRSTPVGFHFWHMPFSTRFMFALATFPLG